MTREKAITITVAVWAIIAGIYAYYYVKSILALPNLSRGYESDWDFQLLMFCIFRLPLLLIGLIAVIAFEIVVIQNKGRSEK